MLLMASAKFCQTAPQYSPDLFSIDQHVKICKDFQNRKNHLFKLEKLNQSLGVLNLESHFRNAGYEEAAQNYARFNAMFKSNLLVNLADTIIETEQSNKECLNKNEKYCENTVKINHENKLSFIFGNLSFIMKKIHCGINWTRESLNVLKNFRPNGTNATAQWKEHVRKISIEYPVSWQFYEKMCLQDPSFCIKNYDSSSFYDDKAKPPSNSSWFTRVTSEMAQKVKTSFFQWF